VSSTDSSSSHKNEFLGVLQRADKATSALQAQLQDRLADTTHAKEIAGLLQPIIQAAPDDSVMPPTTWIRLTDEFRTVGTQAEAEAQALTHGTFYAASTSSQLTTSVMRIEASSWIGTDPAAKQAAQALGALLHRPSLLDEVLTQMRSFGLVTSGPERSPAQLLQEANTALSYPSPTGTQPAAVLIPARESIEVMLAALLRRRTRQESVGSGAAAKVFAVAAQCALPGLPQEHFARLGEKAHTLRNDLSGAKQKPLDEYTIRLLFDDVLHFHLALLSSLNPAGLR
jgi:hypothetical protein